MNSSGQTQTQTQTPAIPESASTAPALSSDDPRHDSQSDHHSVYCPTCSSRLFSRRCKLICANCGYYLSCADYY